MRISTAKLGTSILFALPILGLLSLYAIPASGIINGDWCAYAEVAQQILDGRRLYDDTWQDKPPLAILYYLPPQLIARGSTGAQYVFLTVWLALQCLAILWLTRDLGGRLARWSACYLTCLMPLTGIDFAWPSTVTISNLFVLINLLIAFRFSLGKPVTNRLCILAGICTALAFNSRQCALFPAVVPAVGILFVVQDWQHRVARIGAYFLGLVFAFLAVIGLVWLVGDVGGYWETVFEYPRIYASQSGANYNAAKILDVGAMFAFPNSGENAILFPWVVLGVMALLDSERDFRQRLFLIGANLAVVLAAVSPMRFYFNYLLHFVPIMCIHLMLCLTSSAQPVNIIKRAAVGSILFVLGVRAAGVIGMLIVAPNMDMIQKEHPRWFANVYEVADWVDQHAEDGDRLFVYATNDSETMLYFASRTPPVHRLFWTLQLNPYWVNVITKDQPEPLLQQYETTPPNWLVILTTIPSVELERLPNGRRLADAYLARYSYTMHFQFDDWIVYRLVETDGD